MSFLRRKVREIVYDRVEYWNGFCPNCKEHIGIDILRNRATGGRHAFCPVCGKDIVQEIGKK